MRLSNPGLPDFGKWALNHCMVGGEEGKHARLQGQQTWVQIHWDPSDANASVPLSCWGYMDNRVTSVGVTPQTDPRTCLLQDSGATVLAESHLGSGPWLSL